MAGISIYTDAHVQKTDATFAARTFRRLCRAQPELAGLVIGALLSAPLVIAALISN